MLELSTVSFMRLKLGWMLRPISCLCSVIISSDDPRRWSLASNPLLVFQIGIRSHKERWNFWAWKDLRELWSNGPPSTSSLELSFESLGNIEWELLWWCWPRYPSLKFVTLDHWASQAVSQRCTRDAYLGRARRRYQSYISCGIIVVSTWIDDRGQKRFPPFSWQTWCDSKNFVKARVVNERLPSV